MSTKVLVPVPTRGRRGDLPDEIGIAWNDAEAAIPWPLAGTPLLSARDQANRPLREVLAIVEGRKASLKAV